MKKSILLLGCAFLTGSAIQSMAATLSGDLYFTIYSGAPNVGKVGFTYDGVSTFSLSAPTYIGTTLGADGIMGNPQNSDLLLVGGQGGRINTISKSTGTPTSYASPAPVFHLAVPDSDTVLGSGIPGSLARHKILAGGAVGPGTLISLSGSDSVITTIIPTPGGYYYTAAGPGGYGNFGKILFNNADVDLATSAITTSLGSYAAAHGGVYDPFTGDIILMGEQHITQMDLVTGLPVSDRAFSGSINFDQGALDGAGHLFAASNDGNLVFVDYATTGLAGSLLNFSSVNFVASYLDDVAPLIGAGGTHHTPESAPGVEFLAALCLLGFALALRQRPVTA